MKLTCPGLADLVFNATGSGLRCRVLDVGWPATRDVTEPRPLADGAVDRTEYIGPRAVALTCVIHADDTLTRAEIRDQIAAFCHPSSRPTLVYSGSMLAEGTEDRMIALRPAQGQAVVDNPVTSEVLLQFVGYTGLIEAATASTATVLPLVAAPGRSYNLVHNRIYPGPMPDQSTDVTYAGSMAAWPVVTITGPVTGPVLTNTASGLTVSFPGLVVGADQTLVLDFAARTVLLDGTADRYSFLDFAASTWWQLTPGVNGIVFDGDAIDTGAQAVLSWRSTYLI